MTPTICARGVIRGVVTAVPKSEVDNTNWPDAIAAAKVTGVESRRHAWLCSQTDLAVAAAENLLRGLGWAPESVDFVVYVTQTPDGAIPSPAFAFHRRLGLSVGCIVMPLNWSCSGFVQGLSLAMILAERAPNARVLLVTGDVTSTICDTGDRATAPLFGDAVSVTAVGAGDTAADATTFYAGNDGKGNEALAHAGGDGYLHMDGPQVFAFTLKRVPPLAAAVLSTRDEPPRYALFHQANAFMLNHLSGRCKFDPATIVPTNISRWGNTSSASIPLLICELPKLAPDTRAAIFGFGAGWAWAGANVLLGKIAYREIVEL